MRKLLIGLGLGALFAALILGLVLLKAATDGVGKQLGLQGKAAGVQPQSFDEDYMAFYGLDRFDTRLPVLYIDTQGRTLNAEAQVAARFSILNAKDDGTAHNIAELPDITLNAGVKYRGASSVNFDKRQYRVSFYRDASMGKKVEYDLLGMGASDSWVLHGPFLDKTLARNYLVYTLGREIMAWAPECRYVELFVNGQYQGVYLAVEPVSVQPGSLDLSEYALLSGKTAYVVTRNREGSDILPLMTYGKTAGYTSNDLFVEYPGKKKLTEKERRWITNDISAFEIALYGDDYRSPDNGYAAHIDVDNFVDYYILNEVVMNHDAGNLSTYAYKEIDGKLRLAIWDYNNCYDNYQWFREDFEEFYLPYMAWFDRLVTDRAFVDKVVRRYYELRGAQLSTEHMYEILDRARQTIGDALERNFVVWGYTFERSIMSSKSRHLSSYEQADAQLREAILKRFNFLDEHIKDLYQFCED